jgi:hypothetical protein
VTRTEERLTTALAVRASQVREETLRPLRVRAAPSRRRHRLLVGLASAVSVLAAIGLAAGLVTGLHRSQPLFADVARAGSPPPYYVYVDLNDEVVVRASAGRHAITDFFARPIGETGCGTQDDCAIAESANGRAFVLAVEHDLNNSPESTYLYGFSLTASGKITGYHRIPSRPLPGMVELRLAVSPSGSRVAIAGVDSGNGNPVYGPPRLFVVNVRTGHESAWHARLAGAAAAYSISSVWWAGAGSQVDFLLQRCPGERGAPFDVGCQNAGRIHNDIWSLDVAHGASIVGTGRRILKLPGDVVQVVPGLDSTEATILTVGRKLSVEAIWLRSGGVKRHLYTARANPGLGTALLTADASGRYLIMGLDQGIDWIHDGQIMRLDGCPCVLASAIADSAAW